jgi:molecular chaperone GrpE
MSGSNGGAGKQAEDRTQEQSQPKEQPQPEQLLEGPQQEVLLPKPPADMTDYKDKYFRALAEIENTRKRLQREKIESQSYAIQNVVLDFLQPLDHLEQALKHAADASCEIKHWALGFEMILTQMKQVLEDHGVQLFDSRGQQFDPHQHEAIETEERTDVAPGTIVEEYVRGYKLGSRVIRPAKVKVATQPSTE